MKNKIKAYFKKHPTASLKARQLLKKLKYNDERTYQKLKYYLYQLLEEGYLVKIGKKYSLNRQAAGSLIGTIFMIDGGSFAFVVLDNSKLKDVFIAGRNTGTAFHGDKVEVELFAKQKGKNIEGAVKRVVKRNRTEIIGTLKKSKSFWYVKPDEKEIHRNIYVSKDDLNGAIKGDKVVVGQLEWFSDVLNPEGKITEVLGKAGSYESEIAALAREFHLSYSFPEKVLEEADQIPLEIPAEEYKKRLDLRDEIIFTIDPDDAKDFDDAVSIKKLNDGNFEIGVHIADVSHYVKPGTELFNEAMERGNSVYLVGRVIPMLPERLSNKICSLVPEEDRLTYSVLFKVTPRGKLLDYKIAKSVINSKKRFTYEEAQEILDSGKGKFYDELFLLNKFAKIFRRKRFNKGSINFSTPEIKFELDKQGRPISIKPKLIQETNQLIEEFMLLANQVIAKHASDKFKELPFVYRVHDLPDEEKLKEFAAFVKSLGFSFDPFAANKSKQFQYLLETVKGGAEEALINEVAIRSMAKAIYTSNNIGHYGLAFDYYTHFTSPIRRFPDLIVHLLLNSYMKKQKEVMSRNYVEDICEHCSATERNAINAERESVKIKQIEFLKSKVGEVYNGVISGVTNFGIFVKLEEILAEGLIRLGDLDDDFYKFNEKKYTLVGRSKGKKFTLGDKLKVLVVRVDEEKRNIDLTIVD